MSSHQAAREVTGPDFRRVGKPPRMQKGSPKHAGAHLTRTTRVAVALAAAARATTCGGEVLHQVLHQVLRARHVRQNGIGGEVRHGATSVVSCETSLDTRVRPRLCRE